MIGFSIEFKRWYITLRGPKSRVYLCIGFAKHLPVFISPAQAYAFDQAIDDSHSAILADEWYDDGTETDEELLNQLKSIR
jgi:hypothetical protein